MKSFSEYLQLNEQEQLNETLYGSWDDFVELSQAKKDNFWNTIPVTSVERSQAANYYDKAKGVTPQRFAGIVKPRKTYSAVYTLEELTPEEQREFGPDTYRAWSMTHNAPIAIYKLDFGSYRIREMNMEEYEQVGAVKWGKSMRPAYLVLLIEK